MIRLGQLVTGPGQQPRPTLDQPIDHLLACHRRIEERLETLERASVHLEDRREEAREAIENSFRFLDSNGVLHTADEEESVFPRLRGRINEQDDQFIDGLEAEHREAEQTYREVKDRCRALPPVGTPRAKEAIAGFRDAVGRLCGLYRKHIEAEDSVLISMARDALDETELSVIAGEMKDRRGLTS